jgi:hypothetical protein
VNSTSSLVSNLWLKVCLQMFLESFIKFTEIPMDLGFSCVTGMFCWPSVLLLLGEFTLLDNFGPYTSKLGLPFVQ